MAYICICEDHANAAESRRGSTAEHLAYIETILDRILVAGPLMQSAGDDYTASCFIYEVDSKAEALTLLHNDPYYKSGVYERVDCRSFRPAAGTWIGGKIW
jgi:uncharacterized protein YciI